MFATQNGKTSTGYFPTKAPSRNETDSLIPIPAACFQSDLTSLKNMLENTTANGTQFAESLFNNRPNNYLHGYGYWITLVGLYAIAISIHVGQLLMSERPKLRRNHWAYKVHLGFQLIVLGVSIGCLSNSYTYIQDLRAWMSNSGLIHDVDGRNPEDDIATFGQLVPIGLCGLTVYTFLQSLEST
jgi:hypothetical protein